MPKVSKNILRGLQTDLRNVVNQKGDYLGAAEDALGTVEGLLNPPKPSQPVYTKKDLDAVINRWFPQNLGVFYHPNTFDLAAVEDNKGNMWRVWADGDTQEYPR